MKTNNVLHAIAALNLEPIKNKLMDPDHGEGWSRATVDAMDVEYRRFLHLMHTFPNEAASPTREVDTFWHYHILDTQKYAADCDDVFGCFMHHNPYGDEASATSAVTGIDRMQELYEATFSEAYIRPEVYFLDQPATETVAKGGLWNALCSILAKPGAAKVAGLTSRCHPLCLMSAKPASSAAALRQSRCHPLCLMAAKPASSAAAVRQSRCHPLCLMSAKPSDGQHAGSTSVNCAC